jgi:dephospho-CoA kinase
MWSRSGGKDFLRDMNRGAKSPPAVAITGGIGCGKSEVACILREDGVPVLDADDTAREVVAPGGDAIGEIKARFGGGIAKADGSLDRHRLADVVFRDAKALADLNAIVHPRVRVATREWVARQRAAGRACAGVIPLLFEVAAEKEWNFVVCVVSSDDVSRERLRARGWSDDEIGRRRAAQWSLEKKRERADVVIENNGALDELAARVRAVWYEILEKESQNASRRK